MWNLKRSFETESDEDLMREIASGKRSAFNELYSRYGERLFRYFCRMLWNERETALDFTQNAFLKILEKPEQYNPSRSFKTWFFSIAWNMCKNEYRRRNIRQTESFGEHGPELPAETEAMERSDMKKFVQDLHRNLDHLDEIQRQTFVLRYIEELSLSEIAAIMECPEGTVKSRLYYTLKKLAKPLAEYRPDKTKDYE